MTSKWNRIWRKLSTYQKKVFDEIDFRCSCFAFLGDMCIGKSWTASRQFVFQVVDNPFFEWTILLLIFASSLSLCFEDINLQDNEELMFILKIVNMVFAVLFFLEMILKWIAFGLWRYFTSAWTCLDFVIVCVSDPGFITSKGRVTYKYSPVRQTLRSIWSTLRAF